MKKYARFTLILSMHLMLYAYKQPYIPLIGTARLGSEKLSYQRLCQGENPNTQDAFGNTPLHYAVFIQSKEVTNLLLAYHADPNAQNKKGKTPLHIAVQKGNDYLARRLMKYGANPNIQDLQGNTPLHIAAHYAEHKHARKLVRDLLCYGADRTLKNRDHLTPGELARPMRLKAPAVHAAYKLKKERSAILALLSSSECYRPYVPRIKRPRRLYAN